MGSADGLRGLRSLQHAVIMEDTSDTILYAKDMDTTLSPAGAVKIMTCLLALENSQLDDQVTMTETGVSGVTDGGAHISSQLGEVPSPWSSAFML